jgi:hypothetical protein
MLQNLTEEQKDRYPIAHGFAELPKDTFLSCAISGDEIPHYPYEPEVKRQSMKCRLKNSQRPKKPGLSKLPPPKKNCFLDIRGIINFELAPKGTIVIRNSLWRCGNCY